MEAENPARVVSDDTTIWRYMDLAKFVYMLATRTLWFSKAAAFHDDPFEGFREATAYQVPETDQSPKVIVEQDGHGKTNVSVPQMLATFSRYSADLCMRARDHLFVNSWCLAPESMAMWETYGLRGYGVAVKSSVGQYRQAAKFGIPSSQYAFKKVEYHDDLQSSPNVRRDFSVTIPVGSGLWPEVLNRGFHKRSCFKYESEWRAALYQDDRIEPGVQIDFDLDQLINTVYVGPRAEKFFVEAVSSLMDKFLLRKPLEYSALMKPPRKEKATV